MQRSPGELDGDTDAANSITLTEQQPTMETEEK